MLTLGDVSGEIVTINAMGCQKEIAGAVVAAKRDYVMVVRDGRATDEVRGHISGLPVEPDARAFAHATRSHWEVENGCHWPLGVTFREEHLRQSMAWLNRFSLSLLKQVPDRKSVAARRRSRSRLIRALDVCHLASSRWTGRAPGTRSHKRIRRPVACREGRRRITSLPR